MRQTHRERPDEAGRRPTGRLSRTALYMALYRALETVERARAPLFRDEWAARFLPPSLRAAVGAAHVPVLHRALSRYADRRAPGARTSAIGRTRFIDDLVQRRAAQGVKQLVLLGAGFDCRAHRMPELRECRVFEVDREATQAFKRRRVPDHANNVRYVSVDFLEEDTFAKLREAGWVDREPSLFVWEGVTNYLTPEAITAVLARVGRTAPGTTIAFTYVHRGVIDGTVGFEGAERILRTVRALGEPWTAGFLPDELVPHLRSCGLTLRQDLGADEYRSRYFGEAMRGYAFYRIAVADVEAAGTADVTAGSRRPTS
jgi:methyltransferase (TIGR00027 family)